MGAGLYLYVYRILRVYVLGTTAAFDSLVFFHHSSKNLYDDNTRVPNAYTHTEREREREKEKVA